MAHSQNTTNQNQSKMKNTLLLIALLITTLGYSQTFDALKLTDTDIPEGYTLTEDLKCIAIQAHLLFKNPEMYSALIGKVKSKESQNFNNKKDSGSILFFEFENNFEKQSFIEGLLWGGKKPSNQHPEEIFVKDNILIIWSFAQNSPLKEISKNKITQAFKE